MRSFTEILAPFPCLQTTLSRYEERKFTPDNFEGVETEMQATLYGNDEIVKVTLQVNFKEIQTLP